MIKKNLKEFWPIVSKQEKILINRVLNSNKLNYWTGHNCKLFEKEYSNFFNKKYGISVCNASVGLDISLKALNLQKDSEVIVSPRSYVSSASCVINNNLKPVFADIDINSQNMCPKSIKQLINKKTKVIILVHLAGYPCEMNEITSIAKKNNIFLIEDCSQSHGSSYYGRYTGSFGDIAVWSFCNDKIINTLGEGGMICVNDDKIYKKIWSLKDCGKNFNKIINKPSNTYNFRWIHDFNGTNLRMTELQAAIGRHQLKKLTGFVKLRKRNANTIYDALKKSNLAIIPKIPDYISHSFYRCYILLNFKKIKKNWSKEKIIKHLNLEGVECNSGSCPEIYKEKVFKNLGYKFDKKNAKSINQSAISFLVHPTISFKSIKMKAKIIKKIFLEAEAND